jgi:hypothetical protein
MQITLKSSFRGASEANDPGIHNHDWGLWIPGLRQEAHPGMTVGFCRPGQKFNVSPLDNIPFCGL